MKIKSAHVLDLVQVENEKEEEKRCTSFDNGNSGQSWSHVGLNLNGSNFILFIYLFLKELTFNGLYSWFWGHSIRPKLSFRLCSFGVILERMENEREKSGEKMMFLVVWLRVEKRRDFGGTHQFSLLPLQNTISPNWRENESESWTKTFGQNCPHFLFIITNFFFWATQPGVINVACLLFFFFFLFFFWVSQFHWMLIFFFLIFF